MDFSRSENEQQLFDKAVSFATENLNVDTITRDHHNTFSTELWQACAREGVIGWATPKELEGSAHSALLCAYLLEGLGYACNDNGLLFSLGTQMWGVQSCLLQFANDNQKLTYVKPMIKGNRIGAYAINERNSGSDAFALSTTAIEDDDFYILNGEKTLISMSTIADFAIVFAVTDPKAGRWGISAFIVDANTPGYSASSHDNMMGLRTVPFGSLLLEECRVPKTALLGKLGAGASAFSYSQIWERTLMLAPHVGAMQRQLEQCTKFSKSRKHAGQSIGKNQSISHRLANMRIRIEASRLLLYKSAWLLTQNKQNLMEAAITKTYISEAFVESSADAIQVYGGLGYLTDTGIERNLRDAMGGTIYGGTVDIQRNIIAGLLGL